MRSLLKVLGVVLAVAGFAVGTAKAEETSFGTFVGNVVASLLPDGRNLKLEQPFAYIDPTGRLWEVPAGIETDGASIPRLFWVSFPPFTGKYRYAAIIHDHYCRTQTRTWQETHNVFYLAMRAAGVEDRVAKLMWAGVYRLGPRWGVVGGTRGVNVVARPSEQQQVQIINDIDAWIARENPSREQIAQALESGQIPKR